MNCRETGRWLSPYLDSELDNTKTFEISEHLRVCPNCANRYERERRVDSLFRSALADAPAFDFHEILRSAIHAQKSTVRTRGIVALAVAACLAIVGWVVLATAVSPSRDHMEDWIADRFAEVVPETGGFPQLTTDVAPNAISTMVRQILGASISISLAAGDTAGHAVRIVSAETRDAENGARTVEIRLNCCGQPVLVAIAARRQFEATGLLTAGAESGVVQSDDPGGINVGTWASESLVLVAASRHELTAIPMALAEVAY